MKKIIIITGHAPYQTYFINSLDQLIQRCSTLSLEGVFLTGKPKYSRKFKDKMTGHDPLKKIAKLIWGSVSVRAIHRLTYPENRSRARAIYSQLFQNNWEAIKTSKIFYEKTRLIKGWFPEIQKISPDIIIVHGGGIVPDRIISLAKAHTFNLHWGISPVYRGSFCSPFCILNDEIQNIGVTIHELSSAIDGGHIYKRARPDIQETDTILSIEMKLTLLGTELISALLNQVNRGEVPKCSPQDLSQGNFYRVKDYSLSTALKVNRKIRKGAICAYCHKNQKTT